MTEHGFIFTGESIRAILAGRKTQTRRIVTDRNSLVGGRRAIGAELYACEYLASNLEPRVAPGDRIWVRETHALIWPGDGPPENDRECRVEFRADGDPQRFPGNWPPETKGDPDRPRWRSPIFMPRWAARVVREVVEVRLDRVQNTSESDAIDEGMAALSDEALAALFPEWMRRLEDWRRAHDAAPAGAPVGPSPLGPSPRRRFAKAWDSINRRRASWARNPWVWAYTFRRSEAA